MTATPELTARSGRAADIVAAARRILEEEGADALTMRRLAAEVGIQAPSLYKHFSTKRAVEAALIEEGLLEFGAALHVAVAAPGRHGPVRGLLDAYRRAALASPALYRLATVGPLPARISPRASRSGRANRSFSLPGIPREHRPSSRSLMEW